MAKRAPEWALASQTSTNAVSLTKNSYPFKRKRLGELQWGPSEEDELRDHHTKRLQIKGWRFQEWRIYGLGDHISF